MVVLDALLADLELARYEMSARTTAKHEAPVPTEQAAS